MTNDKDHISNLLPDAMEMLDKSNDERVQHLKRRGGYLTLELSAYWISWKIC